MRDEENGAEDEEDDDGDVRDVSGTTDALFERPVTELSRITQ